MHSKAITFTALIFFLVSVTEAQSDSILLNQIQVLTLHQGKMTNARRSSPVPQLKCVGGNTGCTRFLPSVVQCYNRGSDGFNVQWDCKAELDNSVKFGRIEVTCEGYRDRKDPFVLVGSCGLEYTLDSTMVGKHRVNVIDNNSGSSLLGLWIFLGILGLVVIGLVIWGIFVCVQSGSSGGSSYRSKTYVSEPPVFDGPSVIVVGNSQPVYPRPPPPYTVRRYFL